MSFIRDILDLRIEYRSLEVLNIFCLCSNTFMAHINTHRYINEGGYTPLAFIVFFIVVHAMGSALLLISERNKRINSRLRGLV